MRNFLSQLLGLEKKREMAHQEKQRITDSLLSIDHERRTIERSIKKISHSVKKQERIINSIAAYYAQSVGVHKK